MSVFAALIMIAASGCDDSEAGPTLPPKTSPTSSSSVPTTPRQSPRPTVTRPTVPADVPTTGRNVKPGEKPPVMPVAALQHNSSGATEFAKFFIQTVDWAYATMSTTYMKHYIAQGCVNCANATRALDSYRAQGRYVIGNRYLIKDVQHTSAVGGPNGADTSVTVTFDISNGAVYDAGGKFIEGMPATLGYAREIFVAWRGASWQVVEWRVRQ